MPTFIFSANGIDFGNYSANTVEEAKELFAVDAGYRSWAAMVEQAEELSGGGNVVEVREVD